MTPWRFIHDGRHPAYDNMPRDAGLLAGVIAGRAEGFLRIYDWQEPAVTIGHHQRDFRLHDPTLDIPVLRRPTGGGAVLHVSDITYAVAARLEGGWHTGIVETYARIAQAFARALGECGAKVEMKEGPERFATVCFQRSAAKELLLDGHKIMGASQVRQRGCFLQQGVIPLEVDAPLAGRVFGPDCPAGGKGLLDLCPGFAREAFVGRLREAFAADLGVLLTQGDEQDA